MAHICRRERPTVVFVLAIARSEMSTRSPRTNTTNFEIWGGEDVDILRRPAPYKHTCDDVKDFLRQMNTIQHWFVGVRVLSRLAD